MQNHRTEDMPMETIYIVEIKNGGKTFRHYKHTLAGALREKKDYSSKVDSLRIFECSLTIGKEITGD